MPAPDLFGILDIVKLLTPPEGFEAVHEDGMSWAKGGQFYEETSRLTDKDWNRIIGNLRGLLAGSMLDINMMDPASPFLLRDVINAYIDGNAIAGASALLYAFDTATADADPGAGKFRLNNAAPASATAAFVDNADSLGVTVGSILDSWDDGTSTVRGVLTLQSKTDQTIRHVYHVTGSVVDGTGYRKLTLAYVGGAGALTDGAKVWLVFVRSGDVPADAALVSAANTFAMKQSFVASAAGGAGVNFAPGVAPTSPADGDMWPTAAGWFVRYGGATRQLATLDGTETLTNKTLTQPTTTLKQSANPTPTAQGVIEWGTAKSVIAMGDGATTRFNVPAPTGTVAGDIEYFSDTLVKARLAKGTARQSLMMNAGATAPEWGDRIVLMPAQATTSGTEKYFTGIPDWAKRIDINFDGVSLSGTDRLLVQIGDAGGIGTSGYSQACARSDGQFDNRSDSFPVLTSNAANIASGSMTLTKVAGNTWASNHNVGVAGTGVSSGGGAKALSDVLTQVRVTRSGANTFDAGQVSVTYYG